MTAQAKIEELEQRLDEAEQALEVERRLRADLEKEVEAGAYQLQLISQAVDGGSDPEVREYVDTLWTCERCHARLAVYSEQDDVMRFRKGSLFIWAHPGPGGYVATVCQSCGHLNTAEDEREEASDGGEG